MSSVQPTHIGGGGFVPKLKRTDLAVSGGPNFLASEKYTAKRSGITIAASTVTADAAGDKIVKAGTFLAEITSGPEIGKYGPYATGATDGRQAPGRDKSGYGFESVNLRDGDVICGLIIHGSVLAARVIPAPDSTIRTAVAGRITFQ